MLISTYMVSNPMTDAGKEAWSVLLSAALMWCDTASCQCSLCPLAIAYAMLYVCGYSPEWLIITFLLTQQAEIALDNLPSTIFLV